MDIASCHTGAYISRFSAHSFGSSPPVPLIAVRFPLIDARSAHRRRFHPLLPVSLLISTGDLRSFSAKVQSAVAIAHSNLIAISQLQVDWDVKIIEVLKKTAPQRRGNELLQSWKQQLTKITVSRRFGFLSDIPGDVHHSLLSHLPENDELPQLDTDDPPPPPEDIDKGDLDADGITDDGDDEEFQAYFAQAMEAQMLRNLAQASNVGYIYK
ncbi:uncharacterized protein PGTG_08519 [Puccinia graminis f. sp. tritici CRL 75-36-700-3]|uniref:Uncharacterized protein n=1 Tax=Puccinia graminis f. sp. tritici (strain CRL 75-36-700-3 / race SCCL) TaxID=418459 RepID=E3KGA8_PUCGT|nr:uncharacterized protein PGTG_08519 [Puccinia graminis f. sp. tritici CRL 75-36-700-3]EFP83333.1 hypothetical protein PGTG_08519 [Puccinia graminis f. sp. tritici CRL 75-36-700-3]